MRDYNNKKQPKQKLSKPKQGNVKNNKTKTGVNKKKSQKKLHHATI